MEVKLQIHGTVANTYIPKSHSSTETRILGVGLNIKFLNHPGTVMFQTEMIA